MRARTRRKVKRRANATLNRFIAGANRNYLCCQFGLM